MEFFDTLWTQIIIRPMLNTLMVLYVVSLSHMGIAIILFTILVRVVTLPLTVRQIRQMRAMSTLQPKLKDIQQRFSRDRARVSQETMRAYREAGVSPIGCLGPLVVQMPILFGLFRVLVQTLFSKPDDLIGLSEKIYPFVPFSITYAAAPLNSDFLWLDLAEADPLTLPIPILVFVTTWVQQKMTMTPSTDSRQQGNQAMMLWMMPLMIAFFSLTFPSGLSLYWIVSNLIGIAIQYFIIGWTPLFPLFPKAEPTAAPTPAPAAPAVDEEPEEIVEHGNARNDRPIRRRGNRAGAQRTRRRPRRGRGRSTK